MTNEPANESKNLIKTTRVLIIGLVVVILVLGLALVMLAVGQSAAPAPNEAEQVNALADSENECVVCQYP